MNKHCEMCKKEIPDDFQNNLCLECYEKVEEDNKREIEKQKEEEEAKKTEGEKKEEVEGKSEFEPVNGITNPQYEENPEQEDKEQWKANIKQFEKTGMVLWYPTKDMYEFIKNWCIDFVTEHPQYPKYIWKPKIVDVGCGIGLGSNIMSQEADFVWGIDKNKTSINFAKQMFSRVKNGIYYNPQLTFDHIDMLEDTREFMEFDVVVAIEIIEHINDYKKFLNTIISKFEKKDKNKNSVTHWFISTPNRNNANLNNDKPKNKYHVREWSLEENENILANYFNDIEILNSKGKPVGDKKDHTPLLAHCQNPK